MSAGHAIAVLESFGGWLTLNVFFLTARVPTLVYSAVNDHDCGATVMEPKPSINPTLNVL